MAEQVSLSQALQVSFQQWETALETISARLEKLEQQVARLSELEQRIAALEQQLPAPNPQPASPAPSASVSPSTAQYPAESRLRLGLPPAVRAPVARWLGTHGVNEQTARNWVDLPLDDLPAALLYAKQKVDAAAKTRSLNRVLYRCTNRHCPCQDMSLPGPLPTQPAPLDDGLPPPVRSQVARWLAEHGANYNTATSLGWRLMPLDPRGALRFARDRIAASSGGGARARGVHLHNCVNPRCICHEVLAE